MLPFIKECWFKNVFWCKCNCGVADKVQCYSDEGLCWFTFRVLRLQYLLHPSLHLRTHSERGPLPLIASIWCHSFQTPSNNLCLYQFFLSNIKTWKKVKCLSNTGDFSPGDGYMLYNAILFFVCVFSWHKTSTITPSTTCD